MALSRRERVLVALALVLGPLLIGYSLFVDPQSNRLKVMESTLATEGATAVRLQAEVATPGTLKWQALVMQAGRNTQEFAGRLEITLVGTANGKTWTASLPDGAIAVKLKQYGRLEGEFQLPPQTVVKSVSARVLEGSAVRATQTLKL
jgi:hypothetical protein